MTPEEQIAALEEATDYLDKKIAVGNTIYCPDMARDILAPMFAKIAALEAERDLALGNADDVYRRLTAKNAALRQRLVVDDAMVERGARAARESNTTHYTPVDGWKPPKGGMQTNTDVLLLAGRVLMKANPWSYWAQVRDKMI